jgi:hypothetical protein
MSSAKCGRAVQVMSNRGGLSQAVCRALRQSGFVAALAKPVAEAGSGEWLAVPRRQEGELSRNIGRA